MNIALPSYLSFISVSETLMLNKPLIQSDIVLLEVFGNSVITSLSNTNISISVQ